MGLIGGAFRVGSYAARTGIRAGTSIASGRVPNLSIGLGLGGFGARIGTRGVSIRTPIASQSIGAHGLTSTIRLPGIASLSVNPIRPSVTAGLGPLRVRASRNPGVMLGSPLLSIGTSASRLFIANVGPFSLSIPGMLTRPPRPWSEEVDDQWMPHYQRRPPAISEQLHDLIRQVENDARNQRLDLISEFPCPQVSFETITRKETRSQFRALKKLEMTNLGIFHRSERRAGKERAHQALSTWLEQENIERKKTQDQRQAKVDASYKGWRQGDPLVGMLVFESIAHINGIAAHVLEVTKSTLRIAVFGPRLDDIHPLGPSLTPSGNPTVKKRSKKERQSIWAELCGAQVSAAAQIARVSFLCHRQAEILVLVPAHSSNFGQLPVVSRASVAIPDRGRIDGLRPFHSGLLRTPQTFGMVHSNNQEASGRDLAFATSTSSIDDVYSPDFWLQAQLIREELGSSSDSKKPRTTSRTSSIPSSHPRSVQPTDLRSLIDDLDDINSAADAASRWDTILQSFTSIEASTIPTTDSHLLEEYVIVLGYIAHLMNDRDVLQRIIALANRHHVDPVSLAELQSYGRDDDVSQHESRLESLLNELRTFIDDEETAQIFDIAANLVQELPHIPLGADDEAADLGWVLCEVLAFLGRSDLIDAIIAGTNSSVPALQHRFRPIITWAMKTLELTEAIVIHVGNHPGTIQSSLAETLEFDPPRVRKICWYLDHFGVIRRQRHGRSYSLHHSEDGSWPVT